MRNYKLWIASLIAFLVWGTASAYIPDYRSKPTRQDKVQYRDVCANSKSQIDQEINNVRARLLGGGDCWWDFTNGRYIVPKVDVASGQREVSSIFAGSVWLGGIDPGGNLKLACQDYRNDGKNDFWPGPLTEQGVTDQYTCANWDKHFRVTGQEIRTHLKNLSDSIFDAGAIPVGVKGWPARGNPYFAFVWGFSLPNTPQALAGFYDADEDGLYNPLKGDYPSIEIRGCAQTRYPDEMIFWIYNDQGGGAPHARTNGKPIQMEVQVQAFGYLTNDELNDMTFHRYKLINRATERIDSTFFAMWLDPDLGCSIDDYIGCDSSKSLMYVYNSDATDGQPGSNCDGGVATYGTNIPILGCDYFRGPLDTFGNEIGMSSFMYYNRTGTGGTIAGMFDPTQPLEYYRYITGSWRDGTRLTYGGSGYSTTNTELTQYALQNPPDDPNGWSMCTANLPVGDRRTLQASGPFTLKPGAVNELIIGLPWVPEQDYPCPNLDGLFRADNLAQGLFDNCFELLEGPDAPDVGWVEMDKEVIAVLSNAPPSNNFKKENEDYAIQDYLAPESLRNSPDSAVVASTFYRFEGYLVYQLKDPNVSTSDFDNTEKSRLVYNVDIKNGVKKLYNWIEGRDPATKKRIYFPEEQIAGTDKGVKHTFSIKEDKFALGNSKSLINHKKYYYAVIAYGYNNYQTFNPLAQPVATGQSRTYIPSRKSGDGTAIRIYTVIPRPIVDKALRTSYGNGLEVTRLEGVGAGGNFLDLTSESRSKLLNSDFDSMMTYKAGRAPITVTIFNPLEVKDGDFELSFVDSDNNDSKLDANARWQLKRLSDGTVIGSEKSIEKLNEQLILQYGFSVSIAQTAEPGDLADERNGAIGMEIEYADPTKTWLTGYGDELTAPFNYVRTTEVVSDPDYDPNKDAVPLDPNGSLSQLGNATDGALGWFVPYVLANWRVREQADLFSDRLITPAWTDKFNNIPQGQFNGNAVFASASQEGTRRSRLRMLPNVDIVFTNDKSKWSRCVVIETASVYWTDAATYGASQDPAQSPESPTTRKRQSFDVRYGLSVGKDDANGDGLPDPDGELNPNDGTPAAGQPLRGMGWFPGYAVDVETGQRLNIFFGENSCYSSTLNAKYTGRDMMWNPTNQILEDGTVNFRSSDFPKWVLGGQHWVYVTYSKYDGCDSLRRAFTPERFSGSAVFNNKVAQVRNIAWAGMLQMAPGTKLLSYKEGLIPTETVVKLRVDNSYKTWWNQAGNHAVRNGHPKYLIRIRDREAASLDQVQVGNSLDSIKAVPNPYYGFSQYETSQFTNIVKFTNLPAKCVVTIYSLDGKFIRQYNRDETYTAYKQYLPDIEWDMKNNKGIPVASGVYLVHINAEGLGERTIKWFGIGRQFDPSGL
ncbi:MAG: hypothetical protein KGS48_02720 [Bacteroidetes bacterium]|nr:hypothetical protein [Bacteroidota bacterium]